MRSLNHSYLDRAGEETRLVVETLLQVVPGTQIVAVVTNLTKPIPGFELEPLVGTDAERAFDSISERVRHMQQMAVADLPVDIPRMAALASEMVRKSLKSFIETGKGAPWPNEIKLDSWE